MLNYVVAMRFPLYAVWVNSFFFVLFSQTSLAVGDTEEVQKEAQLQKLALQVSTYIHVHVCTKGAVASV